MATQIVLTTLHLALIFDTISVLKAVPSPKGHMPDSALVLSAPHSMILGRIQPVFLTLPALLVPSLTHESVCKYVGKELMTSALRLTGRDYHN